MSDDAVYRSPADATSDQAEHDEGSTFPSGTALAALFVWFVLSRALANITARSPRMLEIATFAGVFGGVLAALALLGTLVRAAAASKGGARAVHAARALLAAPVALVVFAAMFGEPKMGLQWAGLVGAASTVVFSAVLGAVRPGAFASARIAFALLLVGESIELAYAPAQAMLPSAGSGAVTMAWLGRAAELCTLLGAVAATVWAYRAGERAVGAKRTQLFLPFPVALGAMIVAIVVMVPAAAAAVLGRTTFGARFDLVTSGAESTVSRLALLAYAIAPTLLLGTAALSTASVGYDNGAGARRSLGWLMVLFAGFGVLRLAGPMDPIRLVMVALAMVLLERAGDREKLL